MGSSSPDVPCHSTEASFVVSHFSCNPLRSVFFKSLSTISQVILAWSVLIEATKGSMP